MKEKAAKIGYPSLMAPRREKVPRIFAQKQRNLRVAYRRGSATTSIPALTTTNVIDRVYFRDCFQAMKHRYEFFRPKSLIWLDFNDSASDSDVWAFANVETNLDARVAAKAVECKAENPLAEQLQWYRRLGHCTDSSRNPGNDVDHRRLP